MFTCPIPDTRLRRSRRAVVAAGLALAVSPAPLAGTRSEWEAFKARFLTADGRIVDTGNQGVTHTEGQGWGMLLAEYHNDAEAYARILDWTDGNLRRPADTLYAWRYDPAAPVRVADLNNATDGDMFIAMALSRAARRWQNARYAEQAEAMAEDIQRLLVRVTGSKTVLLPGCAGFETQTDIVVNPSYYVFPAIRELADRVPSAAWDALLRDGCALLSQARFGKWNLVPDWLQLDRTSANPTLAPNWPPRFSFDAIRVPLYLSWGGCQTDASFAVFARQFGDQLPAWVDLTSNEVAPYIAPLGMQAVRLFATASTGESIPVSFPSVADAPDYYSAALSMLVRMAWDETFG